ncbi:hypothetical protein CARUB_v10006682mg [Capsella rubella]|uniref:Uncharacterized protein n=1 Tax=Capsella rubella TaxID=81985 RepID=R0GMS3_9BRAS|nr:hypothetical protein CARUB_v10006682mg [Capsella rubella]
MLVAQNGVKNIHVELCRDNPSMHSTSGSEDNLHQAWTKIEIAKCRKIQGSFKEFRRQKRRIHESICEETKERSNDARSIEMVIHIFFDAPKPNPPICIIRCLLYKKKNTCSD